MSGDLFLPIIMLLGTLLQSLVFFLVYLQNRETSVGIWTFSWLCYSLRFLFQILILLHQPTTLLMFGYQLSTLVSGYLMILGSYLWFQQKVIRPLAYLFPLLCFWILIASILTLQPLAMTIPTHVFLGCGYIWTGFQFITSPRITSIGRSLVGWAFIVWGLHKLDFPFLSEVPWFVPWGYLLAGLLSFCVSMGFLILFYERTKLSLLESEEKYKKLYELESDAIFLIENETGNILEVNTAACKMYGYSRSELLQMDHTQVSAEPEKTRAATEQQLSVVPIRYHKKKDGTVFAVEITASHIDWNGTKMHIAAIRDIQQRIEIEQSLEQQKRFLKNVIDTIPNGMYVTDSDGRITLANRKVLKWFQVREEELLGQSLQEVKPDHPLARIMAHQDRLILEGLERRVETEDSFLDESNRERWYYTIKQAMPDESGNCIGIISVSVETTELRILERQLLHAQKLESIARLTGGVAHDFNNILTVINGYADMILTRRFSEEKLLASAEQIKKAGDRAASLTQQLLAFSRKQIIQPEVIHVNEKLLDIQKMLDRLLGEDIEYLTCPVKDLGFVNIDPGQLEQIVINLALNARDAMPEGGTLFISTQNVEVDQEFARKQVDAVPGSYVMISISDTGCGMDQEMLSRIFEPFFTTKEQGKGTGLGLSTVYGIVKQNQGFIVVTSKPGSGSTFQVYLPRHQVTELPHSSHLSGTNLIKGNEMILIAEDDDSIRALLTSILSESGYQVISAGNGRDALNLYRAHQENIHLIVSDVVMPVMSGRELISEISQINRDVKFVIMSGYTDDAVIRDGILDECINFLQKPISPENFLQKVREVLDESSYKSIRRL